MRVPLDPPEPACRPQLFTTHRQALDWSAAEQANLTPAVRQAAALNENTITWKLSVTLSLLFELHWQSADWLTTSEIGHRAAQHLGDRRAETWTLINVGEAHLSCGHLNEAAGFFQRALASADTGDQGIQWACWHTQGMAFLELQARRCRGLLQARGAEHYRQARDIFGTIGDRHREANTLIGLGEAQRAAGDNETARQSWREALAILEDLGDPRESQIRARLKS